MMIMKTLSMIAVLTALSFVLGCKRESSSDQTSVQTESSQTARSPGPAQPDTSVTATPTSKNTDATNRVYQDATGRQPDNTGKNVRDRDGDTLTPGDQGTTDADREITRQIRRAITSQDQLSTIAKNVKIITVNGKVTLRGPVKSEQERAAITSAAQTVTGVTALDNQLEVKAETQ
jgi:hyperosmotically inducible periplasmic protein